MAEYLLTVSGKLTFEEDGRDDSILQCLQGLGGGERLDVAIQELEENATNLVVELKEVT